MIAQPVFSYAKEWLVQPQYTHYASAAPLHDTRGWLVPALRKVAALSTLSRDWDSYDSPPIRPAALDAARQFLNNIRRFPLTEVEILPLSGGGIGLIFQCGEKELEIEVRPEGNLTFLKQGPDIVEGEGDEGAFSPLSDQASTELVDWLLSN